MTILKAFFANKLNIIITSIVLFIIFVLLFIKLFVLGNISISDISVETLNRMYTFTDINTLTTQKPYFTEVSDKQGLMFLDIENNDTYMSRYSRFDKKPTKIHIDEVLPKNNKVYIVFEFYNELVQGRKYLGVFSFDKLNKIKQYDEFQLREVMYGNFTK